MSIVRIGLAETKNFADGYDAIFGGKKAAAPAKKNSVKAKAAGKSKAAKAPKAKKKSTKKK